jgi:hypothetical protein
MLKMADRPIPELVKALAQHGVAATYLVPTETGLAKSILDAHALVRDYLSAKGIHQYDRQAQGAAGKRRVPATVVTPRGPVESFASLYRPETKGGDPRIWVGRLGEYAAPGNVVAIVAVGDRLVVANLSDRALVSDEYDLSSTLLDAIAGARVVNPHAGDLLRMIEAIGARGFVDGLRPGPTNVGFTLESLLGIKANARRAPDYKGIELKASRSGPKMRDNRITLFSKTPDWPASACKNGAEILRRHGYDKDGRLQLYCSLANTPNSLGHYLRVDGDDDRLHALKASAAKLNGEEVVNWDLAGLRKALADKHKETFWVKAAVRQTSAGEAFHYREVHHTQGPLVLNLGEMLDAGRVELDYTLSMLGHRARDHGYLFKIFPKDMVALFPPPTIHRFH